MPSVAAPRLLVMDLDNTLWDWVQIWSKSFATLLKGVSEQSGVPQDRLEREIRAIHQLRRTTEYSNLLEEIPSLVEACAPLRPWQVFGGPLHEFRATRKAATVLYPGVRDSLCELKASGVRITAYTESQAFWTQWRIRQTKLDGIIDVLYSAVDHELPEGMTVDDLRTGDFDDTHYVLRHTQHHHTPVGEVKPSAAILRSILEDQAAEPYEAVYIGDSLIKDVAMAQSVGVTDVHAAYGVSQYRPEYELLRRVSHWSDEDVERERAMQFAPTITPTHVCDQGFRQLLPIFGVGG